MNIVSYGKRCPALGTASDDYNISCITEVNAKSTLNRLNTLLYLIQLKSLLIINLLCFVGEWIYLRLIIFSLLVVGKLSS